MSDKEKAIETQPDIRRSHRRCLLCGDDNPWSLKLAFRAEGDAVKADFQAERTQQGYRGLLHGGVIAAVLDASMTHWLFHHGVRGVTGDLRVRFLRPVPCRATLEARARLSLATPPLYKLRAELVLEQQIMAWAEAKFVRVEEDFYERFSD